jgi:transcriptional regulator with XRE-family HTH domain
LDKELREAREFSQGVIETRTGLMRAYVSRIENGHMVPTLRDIKARFESDCYLAPAVFAKAPDLPASRNCGASRRPNSSISLATKPVQPV